MKTQNVGMSKYLKVEMEAKLESQKTIEMEMEKEKTK